MKDKGPQREDYDSFEAWSVMRRAWSDRQSKIDRLFPFIPTAIACYGVFNPLPVATAKDAKREGEEQ